MGKEGKKKGRSLLGVPHTRFRDRFKLISQHPDLTKWYDENRDKPGVRMKQKGGRDGTR